jgi:hypothetical protein
VARWSGAAADVLASLRACVPPTGEIVLESTPNGAGGCFYEEWQRAHETGYVRHFFPWWWEPAYTRDATRVADFTAEERTLADRHGLSAAQIAYRRELRSLHRRLAAQEFAEDAESCFLSSGECVFDVDLIERRMRRLTAPAESRDNERLLIWWPPRANSDYIIAVDPAGGGAGGDYCCAQVIERSSGLQCAELLGHFTPREAASRVAALAREYRGALVVVERNNHGHGVLAHLSASEHYLNVYCQGAQAGWLTSAVTRPAMIENFAAVLSAHPELISSARLLRECRTFVRRFDGASAAVSGAHDDCVMAMAIAHAVRAELAGPNIHNDSVSYGALPNWM